MTKTQMKQIKSAEWKKQNDWGLSPAERTAKRIARAQKRIDEMIAAGKDASLLIELLEDVKSGK